MAREDGEQEQARDPQEDRGRAGTGAFADDAGATEPDAKDRLMRLAKVGAAVAAVAAAAVGGTKLVTSWRERERGDSDDDEQRAGGQRDEKERRSGPTAEARGGEDEEDLAAVLERAAFQAALGAASAVVDRLTGEGADDERSDGAPDPEPGAAADE